MAQEDIKKLLKQNPTTKYTIPELAKLLGVNASSLNHNCKSMRKHQEVNYEQTGRKYIYWHREAQNYDITK